MIDTRSPHDKFQKVQRIARGLLLLYLPGVLYAGMVALGMFAYGLAHASADAAAGLLGGLSIVMLLALGLPLVLLLPGLSPAMKLLKGFAMLVQAAGLVAAGKAVLYAAIEPAVMTARFQSAMKGLSIAGVTEQPLLIDGKVVGLRLGIDVLSRHALDIDPQGGRALEFMQRPTVTLAQGFDGSREAALQSHQLARLSLNGRLLEAVPGLERTTPDRGWPPRNGVLPAGVYHVEQDLYLAGLDQDAEGVPCRMESAVASVWLKRLAASSGRPMIAIFGVRMALRDRLGYRYFQRETAPLKFRYNAAQWEQDLAQLPTELCSAREERHKAAEKAAARARFELQYAAGDPTLNANDNPLYDDMCAEDLAPLRQHLALGMPRYLMSGKLIECGIIRSRPELFSMVMLVLYTRIGEDTQYCDVVRFLHSRRALSFLQQLEAMKLPLACEGERRHDWRDGIQPADANGSIVALPPDEESLRWLQVLVRGGVPVCEPIPGEGTLLSRYVNTGPVPLIELLLKAGCDPRLRPARHGTLGSLLPGGYSPQVWWAVRRFIRSPRENIASPVDAARHPLVSALMGDASAAELNEPDPESGRTFLHEYGGIAINEPDLMMYLLARGLRLDAATHRPARSWYSPGYHRSDNNELRERPMLDRLSQEQLRQLIAPRDSLDGSPGVPMEESSEFSEAGLGRYLCGRGVVPCPDTRLEKTGQ